eukprot:223779_1
MGAAVIQACCTGEDERRQIPSKVNTEKLLTNDGRLQITSVVVIDYIISLSNDELQSAWESIDTNNQNKIHLDHQFKMLLIVFVDGYIKTQIAEYDPNTNHQYATVSRTVANELVDDFEQILGVHENADNEYIEKPFYIKHFKPYFVEIRKDNY